MTQARTEAVTEQHGIPPVDRVRRMIAVARPVPGRCVIPENIDGEAGRQLRPERGAPCELPGLADLRKAVEGAAYGARARIVVAQIHIDIMF